MPASNRSWPTTSISRWSFPLKAIVRGYRYAVVPNELVQPDRRRLQVQDSEMGSRYLFVIFYCYLEKLLMRNEYRPRKDLQDTQLQVWSR